METFVRSGPKNVGTRFAGRHCYFEIDKAHAKKYNENYRYEVNSILFFSISGVILLFLGIWLFTFESLWVKILGSIICLPSLMFFNFAIATYMRFSDPTAMLKRGVLNPGMIAKIDKDEIGVLVLAELTIDNRSKEWGLHSMKVKKLPNHEIKIGEKVPVTCSFLGTSKNGKDQFDNVYPTIIAWGTNSRKVLDEAVEAIEPLEWLALEKMLDRYKYDEDENKRLQRLSLKDIVSNSLHTV